MGHRTTSRRIVAIAISVASTGALWLATAGAQQPQPTLPIKQLMETTITDASNAIWSATEAPTAEAEWQTLETAALALVAAARITAVGGTGPMDNEWAKKPEWQAFNTVMLTASEQAVAAIRAKNYDALLAASDTLYPPCEGCHLQFNPGVVNQEN
jgi:cytochrome c556